MSEQQVLPPHARNIHGEVLPEAYRFTPEDEVRLDSQDFYSHGGGLLPLVETTEADNFIAWRWYGQFMVPCTEERLGAMAWRIGRERQLLTTLASLAQSEAERERLQGEHKALLAAIDDCPTGREYLDADKLVSAFIKEQERLRADLVRERELVQGLRQIVKEYRNTLWHGTYCGHYYGHDPCPICIKADSLLEDNSKPAVTAEK